MNRKRAGQYRHRVDIQYITDRTADDTGQAILTWGVKAANVPCDISWRGGDEFPRNEQTEAREDVFITLRNPGRERMPTPEMRCRTLNFEPSQVFNIVHVKPVDAQRREFVLKCKAVVS